MTDKSSIMVLLFIEHCFILFFQSLSSIQSYLLSLDDLNISSGITWYNQHQLYTGKSKYTKFSVHGLKLFSNSEENLDIRSQNATYSLTRITTRRHHKPQRIVGSTDFLWPEVLWILLPVCSKQDLKNFSVLWKELKYRKLNFAIKVLILQIKQNNTLVQSVNFPKVIQDKSIYNFDGELRQLVPHKSLSSSVHEAYSHGLQYINAIYKKFRRKEVVLLFLRPFYSFSVNFLRRCVSLSAGGSNFAPRARTDVMKGHKFGDVDLNVQIGYADELLENEGPYSIWEKRKDLRCVGLKQIPVNLTNSNIDYYLSSNISYLVANDPELFYDIG